LSCQKNMYKRQSQFERWINTPAVDSAPGAA
jgi:hypothetical protein